MVMYVLLFCSTGFYCACRAGFDLSVYCAVWNQLIAVSDIFGCFKCIAGVSDRNSFYFLEGAIAFFLVNDRSAVSVLAGQDFKVAVTVVFPLLFSRITPF